MTNILIALIVIGLAIMLVGVLMQRGPKVTVIKEEMKDDGDA